MGQSSSGMAATGSEDGSGTWWYRSELGPSTDMGDNGGRGMSCG